MSGPIGAAVAAGGPASTWRRGFASWRSWLVLGAIAAFLLALLLIPVATVFVVAFRDGDGSFTPVTSRHSSRPG
jgi:ABC-type spermidine/putrescine transport system permease subunit II